MGKYRIVTAENGGFGANENGIGIEHIVGDTESVAFVAKLKAKAEEIWLQGMSLDAIGTSYGIYFRYPDKETNRRLAKLLIKLVEIEEELQSLTPERWKKGKKRP